MRIARVLTRLNLGGPARQVLASDPLLVGRGHTIRVFAGSPEPGEGDLFETLGSHVEVVRVPGLKRSIAPIADARARAFLRRAFDEFRPDLLHTHAFKAGWVGRGALGSGATRPANVHTFHGHVLEGYFPGWVSRRLVALERRLAAETDRIVAVSHATGDDLVRLGVCSDDQLTVVPPGIRLDELLGLDPARGRGAALRAEIGAAPEDFVVGVIGRLAAVKEPLRALSVFELLAERHSGLHVAFVGDGPERRPLERAIAGLAPALRRRAHLLGARTEMTEVWAGLDASLLSSRNEGAPVALIEAGAAGLPSVARAVGGVEEIIAHERTGYVGATDDELGFGLDQLLADRNGARQMGARARLRVSERFGADALAERLEALYHAVLECSTAEARG